MNHCIHNIICTSCVRTRNKWGEFASFFAGSSVYCVLSLAFRYRFVGCYANKDDFVVSLLDIELHRIRIDCLCVTVCMMCESVWLYAVTSMSHYETSGIFSIVYAIHFIQCTLQYKFPCFRVYAAVCLCTCVLVYVHICSFMCVCLCVCV